MLAGFSVISGCLTRKVSYDYLRYIFLHGYNTTYPTYPQMQPEVFYNKRCSSGKHLCQSIFFNKVTKFLRTPFLQDTIGWLLLYLYSIPVLQYFYFKMFDAEVNITCSIKFSFLGLVLLFTDCKPGTHFLHHVFSLFLNKRKNSRWANNNNWI